MMTDTIQIELTAETMPSVRALPLDERNQLKVSLFEINERIAALTSELQAERDLKAELQGRLDKLK